MIDAGQPGNANEPFDTRLLEVGEGHSIHVEQVGSSDGRPVLFLHGGPGSGCQPAHRDLFDPVSMRAVLFDQRGAGRSRPWLRLEANTTAHLVADIERIRTTLGIERWTVVGGSWGSTLALAYAEAHPARVCALVLRAVFLGTAREVAWAFLDGPRIFRPELHEAFLAFLEPEERIDPLRAYYRRLLATDPQVQIPAAWMWHLYERALSELTPASTMFPAELPKTARPPPTSVIEAHYLSQDCFLGPDQLLADAPRLAGIPGRIVQGRYDLLCPPAGAYALARRWPDCRIEFAESAGHAMSETGVTGALKAAIGEFASR